ncbi:uncharacterized protein FFM5_15370 [Fusarium fujikuroi]|nr:uncharacterized protein FFM5_15370 [Fusarium fujikuroi]
MACRPRPERTTLPGLMKGGFLGRGAMPGWQPSIHP